MSARRAWSPSTALGVVGLGQLLGLLLVYGLGLPPWTAALCGAGVFGTWLALFPPGSAAPRVSRSAASDDAAWASAPVVHPSIAVDAVADDAGGAVASAVSAASTTTATEQDRLVFAGLLRISTLVEGMNGVATRSADAAGSLHAVSASAGQSAASVRAAADHAQLEARLSASRIREATSVIHEVAEETKCVAINAAIEAARAGAEGRAFAVIARSVEDLSRQVAKASLRVDELVADYGRRATETHAVIRSTADAIQANADTFDRVAQAIAEIQRQSRGQVSSIADINGELNTLCGMLSRVVGVETAGVDLPFDERAIEGATIDSKAGSELGAGALVFF